jgi:hypothetical protein
MHFHLPKPLHGWRAFAGEVGIIVVGVLIALAFEAALEDLKWRAKVGEARTELRHEVGHNLALLKDRISQRQCVDRRLDELGALLARASSTGRLPPVGEIGEASTYTWPTSVWDSEIAAQTITHFPADQTAAISRVYRFIGFLNEASHEELQAWQTLNTMVGPGRPIDPATMSRLIEALVVARHENGALAFQKRAIDRILVRGGLGSDFPQPDPKNPPVLSPNSAICQPIGKPPPMYGMD